MRNNRLIICKIFLLILDLSVLQTTAGQQAEGIHKAVTAGDLIKVRSLIKADPKLMEIRDNNGNSPLNLACLHDFTRESDDCKISY